MRRNISALIGIRTCLFGLSVGILLGTNATAAPLFRTVNLIGQRDFGDPPGIHVNSAGDPSIDEMGRVAFSGAWGDVDSNSGYGVWSEADGDLALLAKGEFQAPGLPAGVEFFSFGRPTMNDVGRLAFSATAKTGNITTHNGLWSDSDGTLQLVTRAGGSAPDTPVGAKFDQFSTPLINRGGQIAFMAQLSSGSGGVDTSNDRGIWMESGGTLVMVAREGNIAPGAPANARFADLWDEGRTIVLNEAGQIAFYTNLKNGDGGVTSANDAGIWMGSPGSLRLVVREADPVPQLPLGTLFNDFTSPVINNAGQAAFEASLRATNGTVHGGNDKSIWSEAGGTLDLVAREGNQPPGTPAGAVFGGIEPFQDPLINSTGKTAFVGEMLEGAGGVTGINNSGIWAEKAAGLSLVAREGQQAPDTPEGALFGDFRDERRSLGFNGLGEVAFHATLQIGSGGVTPSNDEGIWAQDSNGVLRLIARTGDQFDVDHGPGVDMRIIQSLGLTGKSGNEDGRGSSFNDRGQVVFKATFLDGIGGVFVSNIVAIPELPGDFNDDGKVDAADYTTWRDHLGVALLPNDATPRLVDDSDLAVWRASFGAVTGGGASQVATVPEPHLAVAIAAGLVGWSMSVRSRFKRD